MSNLQMASLTRIDEPRLEEDTPYRFQYLARFVGFGPEDIATIHQSVNHLAPLVPTLVDAVYVHLFQFDATKRHFLVRNKDYSGPVSQSLDDLTLDQEQIRFRKQHLTAYLVRLVTGDYGDKMSGYLDMVGKIHTPKAGNPELAIPLVQMNVLMGFVSDALLGTILSLPIEDKEKNRMARSFNKLLWIQNDLISRHYAN